MARRIAVQAWAVGLVLIVAVGAVGAAYAYLGTRSAAPAPACDTKLSDQIGAGAGVCLHPLSVVLNTTTLDSGVPVLIIKPGTAGSVDILYHLSVGAYVSHPNLKPNLTAAHVPLVLSVATASINRSLVGFSNGTVVFKNSDWVIYRYGLESAPDSAGYYAILPPYYWGMYPALYITSDPGSLNASSLSLWGFTGCCMSGEVTLPATIVGTHGFEVVNETVPGISYCPNLACDLISRSLN